MCVQPLRGGQDNLTIGRRAQRQPSYRVTLRLTRAPLGRCLQVSQAAEKKNKTRRLDSDDLAFL